MCKAPNSTSIASKSYCSTTDWKIVKVIVVFTEKEFVKVNTKGVVV
jgi:hypothetical protein